MRIIAKKKIRDYYAANVQSKIPLSDWYYKLKNCSAVSLSELRGVFNSADPVHGYTVFNVGGNNYRVITVIHYNTQRCYIRAIWTHAEYDKKDNKHKLTKRLL